MHATEFDAGHEVGRRQSTGKAVARAIDAPAHETRWPTPDSVTSPLRMVSAGGELDRIKAHIRSVCRQHFGADIEPAFDRYLITGRGHHDFASVGVGDAGDGPLFLEQYLDDPIESLLTTASNRAVPRSDVIEFGHLVGAGRRVIEELINALIAWAEDCPPDFVCLVLTRPLARRIRRSGITLTWLADADPERVEGADTWGDYYALQPAVYYIDLEARRQQR